MSMKDVLDPVNPNSSGSMNDQNTFVNVGQDHDEDQIPWVQIILIGAVASIGLFVAQKSGLLRKPFFRKLLVSKAAQKVINTYFDRKSDDPMLH